MQAGHLFEESHTRLKDLGDDARGEAFALYDGGRIAYLSGDPVVARAHCEESLPALPKDRGGAVRFIGVEYIASDRREPG